MIGAVAALALAASACPPPARGDGPLPWAPGERHRFAVDAGASGGTLELSVERPMAGGRLLPLHARYVAGRRRGGDGLAAAVAFSWVDAGSLAPSRFREEVALGGRRRVVDARPGAREREWVVEASVDGRTERRSWERSGPSLDPLSLLYLLRSARLAPGDRFCFDLVADGSYWAGLAVVAPAAQPAGSPLGPADAIRIELALRRSDRPEQRREARVLLGAGPAREILAVEAGAGPGRVRARLVERRSPTR